MFPPGWRAFDCLQALPCQGQSLRRFLFCNFPLILLLFDRFLTSFCLPLPLFRRKTLVFILFAFSVLLLHIAVCISHSEQFTRHVVT